MKKGRFLWSAHRITERQKAGKARNIKGKQLKNSRSTDLKQLVEHHSSQNVNHTFLERTISEKNFKPLRENSLGGLYFDKIVELY